MNNLPDFILIKRGNRLDEAMTMLSNRPELTDIEQRQLEVMAKMQQEIDAELERRAILQAILQMPLVSIEIDLI